MKIKLSKYANYQLQIIRKLKVFKTGFFTYTNLGSYKFITNIIFVELNKKNINTMYEQIFPITKNNLSIFCFNQNNYPKSNWLLGEKILIINNNSLQMVEYF